MTVQQLAELLGADIATVNTDAAREVTCGYACDLLSWVMARGKEGMAWITVQAHMNVVAVATLADMSCIIAAEGVKFPKDVVQKADDEGIAILLSAKNTYQIAAQMGAAGIG